MEICEHLYNVKRPWFVTRVSVSDEGKRMHVKVYHITYRIENNTIVTGARDNAVSAAENRMGRFLLVYRGRILRFQLPECIQAQG